VTQAFHSILEAPARLTFSGASPEEHPTAAVGFTAEQWRNEAMAETKSQDAITLLREDHRKVEDLFGQFEKASDDGRKQKLALEICKELTIHTMLEEEIFYPACEGKVEEDLLKESFVEHDAAKVLIAEIEAGDPSDDFYDSKVKVLKEEIEHHVEEEELPKKGLFAQAREADIDMKAVGDQLIRRKEQLQAEIKSAGLPEPETTTLEKV
jgi:hemerythrin superfamily protein